MNIVVKKVSQAVDSYIYNDSTGEITIKPSTDLLTINVVVSDPQAGAEIPINDINYLANPLDEEGMDLGKQLTYRMNGKLPEGASASENDRILESPTSIVIEGTDSGDDTPTITKVGSFADGENDKAVAYMLETTAVAGNTVTATGTITFANDTTKPATLKPQSVNANVETNGAVALGIIVQFDGTWKDFVITEMAIN